MQLGLHGETRLFGGHTQQPALCTARPLSALPSLRRGRRIAVTVNQKPCSDDEWASLVATNGGEEMRHTAGGAEAAPGPAPSLQAAMLKRAAQVRWGGRSTTALPPDSTRLMATLVLVLMPPAVPALDLSSPGAAARADPSHAEPPAPSPPSRAGGRAGAHVHGGNLGLKPRPRRPLLVVEKGGSPSTHAADTHMQRTTRTQPQPFLRHANNPPPPSPPTPKRPRWPTSLSAP
jgi:hypothetical protein